MDEIYLKKILIILLYSSHTMAKLLLKKKQLLLSSLRKLLSLNNEQNKIRKKNLKNRCIYKYSDYILHSNLLCAIGRKWRISWEIGVPNRTEKNYTIWFGYMNYVHDMYCYFWEINLYEIIEL